MRWYYRLSIARYMFWANRYAQQERFEQATSLFALVRDTVVAQADMSKLDSALHKSKRAFAQQREVYRKIFNRKEGGPDRRRVLILDTSLGLPRPDRMDTENIGAEGTYPWLLGPNFHPISLSQRDLTTEGALQLLNVDSNLPRIEAAVVHLGFNDCVNRVLVPKEQLALEQLGAKLRDDIVAFSRTYRQQILRNLPTRNDVPLDVFRRNLDLIILFLKGQGAQKIILATIIAPPSARWAATPGVNLNFALYNQEIIAATARHGVTLCEVDRMVLEGGQDAMLLADGMHLSDAGHQRFAQALVTLLDANI